MKINTLLVHAGQDFDPSTRAIIPPPYLTSTYVQESPGVSRYEYGRTDNPSFRNLEKVLTSIEKGGKDAVVYSSGTGAIGAVIHMLSSGDHILCDSNTYSGTRRIFTECYKQFGVEVSFSDALDIDVFASNIRSNTRLLWVESPSNPLLRIQDIGKLADLARQKNLLLGVDSTFATPLNQSPLALGASFVLHSTTKYIAGHSDVIGGAIVSGDEKLIEKLRWRRNALGLNPSPFDCWLIQRGIKTLGVRMKKHQENALYFAKYMSQKSYVERVIYPGLSSHPQFELINKQMCGYGGVVSVIFTSSVQINNLLVRLSLWKLAESLGGVESMVDYPWAMTQSGLSEEERMVIGIPKNLVRFSVGIEDVEDLIADIEKNILT